MPTILKVQQNPVEKYSNLNFKLQSNIAYNKKTNLNFLSAPMIPISMFLPEICPSNLHICATISETAM